MHAVVGYDGEVPRMLSGYRGPYVPRRPVLYGEVFSLEQHRLREEYEHIRWRRLHDVEE